MSPSSPTPIERTRRETHVPHVRRAAGKTVRHGLAAVAAAAGLALLAGCGVPISVPQELGGGAPAAPVAAQGTTQVLSFTGGPQTVTVPDSVTSVRVTVVGGSGGSSTQGPGRSGMGAVVAGTLAVVPGSQLTVYVGGQGTGGPTSSPASQDAPGGWGWSTGGDGFQGGSGGGGSSALQVGDNSTPDIVAAGGGGAGGAAQVEGGGQGGDGNQKPGNGHGGGGDGGGGGGAGGNQATAAGATGSLAGPDSTGGGGGGAGVKGGSGGGAGPWNSLHQYWTGGGGGGSGSTEASGITAVAFSVDPSPTPHDGWASLAWAGAVGASIQQVAGWSPTEAHTGYIWPTVTVRVMDGDGDFLPGAPVTFSINNESSGYFQLDSGPGASVTVTTDANGYASAPPVMAGEAGSFVLSAAAPGQNGQLSTSAQFTSVGI